jgi:hypothetical protein
MTAEPFGPIYEPPDPSDCPDCPCCTRQLCEQGREHAFRCVGLLAFRSPDLVKRVAACPCSAATTPGTAAHRAAQARAAKRDQMGDAR